MQKVLTAEEMREVDRLTTERYGIPSIILMENAAHAVARVIAEKLGGSVAEKKFLVLCGKGNNGGDGAALARILITLGASVEVNLFGKIEDTKGDARVNFEILENMSNARPTNYAFPFIETEKYKEKEWVGGFYETGSITNFDVIIDALFGTGLSKPLNEELQEILEKLSFFREHRHSDDKRLYVSIDIPSGLYADEYYKETLAFKADMTITFTAPKLANVLPPASNHNGEVHVVNIGSRPLLRKVTSKIFVTQKHFAISFINETRVKLNSYKKTRGTALIIAGSENYSGAAVLSANACFSAGAGMVTVAVPKQIHQIVAAKTLEEVIVTPLENIDVLTEKVSLVAIGCGMANDESTHQFIRQTVENRKTPMVLDAEALNALSPFDLQSSDELPLVLTPHIGEFTRLLGREVSEDKIAEVREFSQKHNVILVLKGERSLISKPDGTVVINPTGTAGISRAGAGDTLTGIITSFIAQSVAIKGINIENVFNATVSAVYIAGLAGEIAAEKYSERLMTATNVCNCLKDAIEKLNK